MVGIKAEMADLAKKWLEMAVNDCKWLKWLEMAVNEWNGCISL